MPLVDNSFSSLYMQVFLLEAPLGKDVDQFLWSICAAVALKNPCWIVSTMVWAFPHVDTGKMLALFAKVRCLNETTVGCQVVVDCEYSRAINFFH